MTQRKNSRTRQEVFLIIFSLALIVFFSWIELKFFGVNSYLFLVVFNLNVILLLVILFLVVRNVVKLFLDRRRKVSGYRLRTKLVISFVSLSLVPTLLMFFIAVKFVQTSVDYWFRNQIDSSLKNALELGKSNYSYIQKDLENKALTIKRMVLHFRERLSPSVKRDIERKVHEYGLGFLCLRDKGREEFCVSSKGWKEIWPEIRQKIKWGDVERQKGFWFNIYSHQNSDYVIGISPVKGHLVLIVGISLSQGITQKMERIVQGVYEYNQLKSLKTPLKMSLYILLGVMTLLIIFGSIWFGLKLSREISSPIQALSLGTKRIALGDLKVRIQDESEDELGVLVKSFNAMAEELEKSQNRLNRANEVLSRQNEELQHGRRYMEILLENITSGVISLDKDNKITTINRAAREMLEIRDSTHIMGKDPVEIMPRECREEIEGLIQGIKRSPEANFQRQLTLPFASGEKKVMLNLLALKDSTGENVGGIMVFEDITELDKMQRLSAWQEVARRIAHEIKNPLTPIKLSAQRLQKRFSSSIGDQTFGDCINVIVRQVDHLQKMVREFSEFAKLPEISPVENEVISLLEELLTLYRISYPSIQWEVELEEDNLRFRFDRSAIKRVIINLLNNAVEALGLTPNPRIRVTCKSRKDVGKIFIEVSDNGPGLSRDELSRIFEPYFSKKKGSTGLGLTIARSLVKDHGGDIQAYTNPTGGITFRIILPA